ncbi:MAG: cell division protein ZapA [Oscillospiraceae bacterium]|jgi:cell division protein ZapA|nr:cell division protein ZapA [Oscillospiraceae bacterium]MBQ1620558.1 cell division protein ZapA [Oscillospiraceae bacterium]MBQ1805973.1 cell division protein ZapA [Oscillospiraceae bacterium]MBQ1835072.1 cell division protein ZapA [Oscillospiraceae bacterium]MBQ2223371.1 cell division protein ZapA [Oscillospiraceae bacterium]
MENRVTVDICGQEYTFVAEEAPSYMQKVGSYVGEKMSDLLSSAKVGRTDAAVLAAANIADELFKEREASEGLRRQLKQYLDEASRAKNEASELKRELFKLQNRK